MSIFTIPNNRGQIRQINSGDLFGELNETFNIDLTTSEGKIKVSQKLTPVLTEGTDIGTPAGFGDILVWDGKYFVLTEDEVYSCAVTDDPTDPSNWSEVIAIGDLDINSTAVIFDGQMRISLNTNIARWNGSDSYANNWWTAEVSGAEALNADVPHTLAVVQSQKETIYVTDGSRIQYLEKGNTPKIVQLDSNVTATCLSPGLSGAMWVGTFNDTNGQAQVYEIYTGEVVGSTSVYRQAYPVNASAVLAIWMRDNVPYIVTEKGEIQAFNGAGFTTLAEFPFKYANRAINGIRSGQIQNSNRSRPVHPRGVAVHEDSVFINVATKADITDTDYPVDTRSHSGIWEFNMKTGVLNHRFSFAHQTGDAGDLVQSFAYPLLVVDNDYTFLMAGGFDAVNSRDNIYMTTSDTPRGWFITPEITSGTITDAYEAIYHKAKTLADGDEIVTMYRTSKRDTIRGTINWTGTNTCTSTDDFSNAEVGDLIRVVSGTGAGRYANITAISASTATYSITLDNAIGTNGTTSDIYCDNFKRDPEAYTRADGEYKQQGGYGTNPWIQFAVFLTGAIEYRQFTVKGNDKNNR